MLELTTPADAEAAFYQAFRALDGELMRGVWAASSDIFCIHPGGQLLTGQQSVHASWLEIMSSADPPQLDYRVLSTQHSAQLAVHLVEEYIRPAGSKQQGMALVLATNVYLDSGRGWRLYSHHASLPVMQRGDSSGQRKVH